MYFKDVISRKNTHIFSTSFPSLSHSLSALMCIGLRHGTFQPHFKLIAAQRHLSVVADEMVQAVKHKVVCQVESGGPRLLTWVDPAVLHPTRTPGGGKVNFLLWFVGWEFESCNLNLICTVQLPLYQVKREMTLTRRTGCSLQQTSRSLAPGRCRLYPRLHSTPGAASLPPADRRDLLPASHETSALHSAARCCYTPVKAQKGEKAWRFNIKDVKQTI